MSEKTPSQSDRFIQSVIDHVRANYQILNVATAEQHRVLDDILRLATLQVKTSEHVTLTSWPEQPMAVITWDIVRGFHIEYDPTNSIKESMLKDKDRSIKNPLQAITVASASREFLNGANAIIVFYDVDASFNSPELRRAIRNATLLRSFATIAGASNKRNAILYRPVLFISPAGAVHDNIRADITDLEYPLPDDECLRAITTNIISNIRVVDGAGSHVQKCPDDLIDLIVRTLRGLSASDAEDALALAIGQIRGVTPAIIPLLRRSKAKIVSKSEIMTYLAEDKLVAREHISGYDNYFDFIERRKQAYTDAAAAAKIDKPRGVVLLGPPGTGKSIVAEMTAQVLEVPGYIIDVGSIFASHVGESEQRMRALLAQIDAQRGCVVVLDEVDKALGDAHNASGDSGVTKRIFGTLLTWLTRKDKEAFVIMTMNRADLLPPEFLRAGRFDATFYTALPSREERRKVLEIHFNRRGVTAADLNWQQEDWDLATQLTDRWAHAELEAAVIDARHFSWSRGSHIPTIEELVRAIKQIQPMSARDSDEIQRIEKACARFGSPVTSEILMPSVKNKRTVVN